MRNSPEEPRPNGSSVEQPLGDEIAFRAIYKAHFGQVYRLAASVCRSTQDAEDVTQETFAAAWKGFGLFRGDSTIRTWLHRIAVRLAWARVRDDNRLLWLDQEEGSAVETRAEEMGGRIDLERALEALPRGARTILLLHEVEGFRYHEIAETLNISIGTVKSQLHRARSLLMEYLS